MSTTTPSSRATRGEPRLSTPIVADRGAQADAGPPMDLISWMSMTSRLAALQRFSMERLANRESVMEHLGQVTLTAMALAVELESREPRCISIDGVLCRAIVHDLEEAVTGDIARPTKHSSPEAREMFERLTKTAAGELARDLEATMPHFARVMYWHHQRAKEGRDGAVVALADILAVATKVWEEVILRGSGAMIRQAHTAVRQLLQFQRRLDAEFERGSPSHEFLSGVVISALEVMNVAASRDSRWFGTKVEQY